VNTTWAEVVQVEVAGHGRMRVACRMPDGTDAPAIAYPALGARIRVGDRVLLNTTAADLGLGTGGVHFVIAGMSTPERRGDAPGHIIKLRYTPLQMDVLAVEEPESPWHEALAEADSVGGMPVVCCELVSQVPAVLAGCRHGAGKPRVALVYTDEAALPLAFSDLLADLRRGGYLEAIFTSGNAFGGDFEAVNVYSALLAARIVAEADIAIVSPGPGTVGTETRFGFGGLAQAGALNAAHTVGGRPIAAIRAGAGDARVRHQGISHHTRTALGRAALAAFWAAWPSDSGAAFDTQWRALQEEAGARMRGVVLTKASEALDAFGADLPPWKTMGRGRADDPLFFEAAAAAGILARRLWREEP
jgi:hypothetical protein